MDTKQLLAYSKGEPKPAPLSFLIVGIPACVVEVVIWMVLVPLGMHWTLALVGHLAVLAFCGFTTILFRRRNWDIRLATTNLILGVILGPFGMAATVLAGALSVFFVKAGDHTKELLQALLPEFKEQPITETARRLRTGLDRVDSGTTPIPFFDLMAFGSIEQKRAVIGATLRYFSPDLTAILRTGLRDPTNSVRVLAATALVTLEEKYHSRFVNLQRELAKYPDDLELLNSFAKHCAAFAFSNLLGDERSATMRQHAIDAYEALASSQEPSEQLSLILARLYLADNRSQDALQVMGPWISKDKSPAVELVMLYADALFRLKRYQELRQFGTTHPEALQVGGEAHETPNPLVLWATAVT